MSPSRSALEPTGNFGKALEMLCAPLGDTAVLAELGASSDEHTAARVRAVAQALESNLLHGVHDIVPSFTTVAAHFDPVAVGGDDPMGRVTEWMRRSAMAAASAQPVRGREVEVPVCYGGEHGADMGEVAERAGISEREVIARHSGATYVVRAIGFSPGFPYLSGLHPSLHTPRRATPRAWVPAGSVAIGGGQTGIYSRNTPGGWNLIGRTPLTLFDPDATPPSLLQIGDCVRFVPVSVEQLAAGARRP